MKVRYRNATIVPASHLTDPIDIENLDMEKLAHEVFIRYVRKDLRKVFILNLKYIYIYILLWVNY